MPRGGPRPGAGGPRLGHVQLTVRIPPELKKRFVDAAMDHNKTAGELLQMMVDIMFPQCSGNH